MATESVAEPALVLSNADHPGRSAWQILCLDSCIPFVVKCCATDRHFFAIRFFCDSPFARHDYMEKKSISWKAAFASVPTAISKVWKSPSPANMERGDALQRI